MSSEHSMIDMPSMEQNEQPENPSIAYSGASVLPYTIWTGSDRPYFLLGAESYGRDKGCWDDWGGSKDKGELHPIVTAAREFTEETMGLLGSHSSRHYIESIVTNQQPVPKNNSKKMVIYIVYIPPDALNQFSKSFYKRDFNYNPNMTS